MQINQSQDHVCSLIEKMDIEFLERLVNQNSRSINSKGVEIVQYLFAERASSIGLTNRFIKNEQEDSADLLISEIKGKSQFTVSTIGHADTVLFPTNKHLFRSENEGKHLMGPGIADNKSGQLIALKGIELFLKKVKNPYIGIQFISSPNEEIGSPGFHEVFNHLGMNSDMVLGFEPSLPCGSIIKSRNGNKWFRLELEGETYHSGRAEKGHMNAAHDLCRIITFLNDEFEKHEDITMNIGQIEGGHSYNTICDRVTVKIDTRFSSFSGLKKIEELFAKDFDLLKRNCRKHGKLSLSTLTIDDYCPPLESNQLNEIFLKKYLNEINNIENEKHIAIHCGGAADVNHFSHEKSISFDGLGAVGGNMHRMDEYILTSSLETRARAFGEYLININNSLEGI